MKNVWQNLSLVILGAALATEIFLYLFFDLWQYQKIDQAVKAADKREYDVLEYNCVDFSQEAVQNLKNQNISSNIVVIKQDPSSPDTHAVICIYIDPQTGEIVSGAEYVGLYNELKTQYGWSN